MTNLGLFLLTPERGVGDSLMSPSRAGHLVRQQPYDEQACNKNL